MDAWGSGDSAGDATPFVVRNQGQSVTPVVLAVPHAGRAYGPALVSALRDPAEAARRLEDRLVDGIAEELARRTGATLIVARAPRALIDLNRAPDDLDRDMIEPDPALPAFPPRARPGGISRRVQGGLGLVPRRLPGMGELWRGRLPAADVLARIEEVHAPYHAATEAALNEVAGQWGVALLIDLHSMPPLLPREPGQMTARYVLGDRFGSACRARLAALAFAHFAATGAPAAHNRPYAGGYTLERHARRAQGIEAMQIEIDRAAYLDSALAEPGAGWAEVVDTLTGLVGILGRDMADVAAAGRVPRAAE
jgi:hypothetical protein